MKTVLVGDMRKIDRLYCWLEKSIETFEVEFIVSENELKSEYYICPIASMDKLELVNEKYDIIFICSDYYEKIENILLMNGVKKNSIVQEDDICKYLSKSDKMCYYSECIKQQMKGVNGENIQIGAFTYCNTSIVGSNDGTKLTVGKFCSIAQGTVIILGGEHRPDWCTTYPFNVKMNEFGYIKGHPKSKGDVVIGNDVWIASHSLILSGVHIGNGSIIAANAVVTKNVEPYTIVGGNPAKPIRKRFDDQTIKKLEEIQWWNWNYEYIYDAIPILQSNHIDRLFEFYDSKVMKIGE